MQRRAFLGLLLGLWALAIPEPAAAIPPPDVILTLSSSFTQIFTLVVAGLGALAASFLTYLAPFTTKLKDKWVLILVPLAFFVLASGLVAGYYSAQTTTITLEEQITTQLQETLPTPPAVTESLPPIPADLPLAISNEEFAALSANSTPYVLDAREDEERALGYLPGSVHIRAGDLLHGAYSQLPKGQTIHVLCWSGIRGQQVAQALRDLGYPARYFEGGAKGWVESGGEWEGDLNFTSVYTGGEYTRLFTTEEAKAAIASGAVFLDVRSEDHRDSSPVPSIPFSILAATSEEITNKLAALPTQQPVIVICDEYVNCFEAKILGVKLNASGRVFLGRYAAPWEWSKE